MPEANLTGSDIRLSDFYVPWINKICNGMGTDGRRFSARLVAIIDDVLIFQNSRGAIFRHPVADISYLEPRRGEAGDGGRAK